jgi:uncharacterized protein (TIGR02145 family)
MAENLNIGTDNSWCYDNQPANCDKYGRLYMWGTAKAACQSLGGGWKLPSSDDWDALARYVGGAQYKVRGTGEWIRANVGKYLKSQTGWSAYGGIQNLNTYGFSAMPGGGYGNGSFGEAGTHGFWWTSIDNYNAIYLTYDGDNLAYKIYNWSGASVRCVSGN